MLTRLEVDGFKNLLGLEVDFGPFTCIAGENGTGKSNLFDAIQFLSLLSSRSLIEAAIEVRGTGGERSGDPRELFWNGYGTHEREMSFAAEMIVPEAVEDDFGREAKATSTYLRYELRLGFLPPSGADRIGRVTLLHESLKHINLGNAPHRLLFPHSKSKFRDKILKNNRSGQAFISTTVKDGQTTVSIHQDGGSRGQPKPAAASRAPATVVSTVTSSDDPTILAARREMQSWQRLALEPTALRAADRYTDPQKMGANGLHLPGTLFRIAQQDPHGDPDRVYSRVSTRLADLAGVSVDELRVIEDGVRELLTVQLKEANGLQMPARGLSEGTLRFLALCVLKEDPSVRGVLCMEEPENGIHPGNLAAMVNLVTELAVDPEEPPGDDNPFRQILVNTHSPGVVQLVNQDDLLFADSVRLRGPEGSITKALRLRPMTRSWRAKSGGTPSVARPDILPYLTTPPGAQTSLEEA
ncbi:AAA family ATPase [Nocardiopsis sp. N85]|uniref:AAA family ATPase n=1 Tax=Nocardiopsis sp. N85 TaxID=3029400 RepID=UPI00237F27D1|nr:AAA family ATPase [Nocardiopsis sp. N85]MDE3721084.1 AAA family ATPase [Nocardiopsis sp. N85]